MRRSGHIHQRSTGPWELRYSLGTDPASGERRAGRRGGAVALASHGRYRRARRSQPPDGSRMADHLARHRARGSLA
jgi:hypothetical protein